MVKDHLNNIFKNKDDMCKYWLINSSTFRSRIEKGWSIQNTLEKPVESTSPVVDPLGNQFRNSVEMCNYWGKTWLKYVHRIQNGMSPKDALILP